MKKILSLILLALALPVSVWADADLDALRAVRLAPCALSADANARLYVQTAVSLRQIQDRVTDLYGQGRVGYYQLHDFTNRLRDAAWYADLYFRALRDQETGSRFSSAAQRARLLGELRQAVDRMAAKLPR